MLALLSTVRARIIAGFGLLVIILAVVVAGSAWLARQHRSDLAEMEQRSATASLLQEAESNGEALILQIELYVITGDESVVAQLTSQGLAVAASLEEVRTQMQSQGREGEAVRMEELVAQSVPLASETAMEVITLRQSGDVEGATAALDEVLLQVDQLYAEFGNLSEAERQAVANLRSRAERTAALAFWLLVISGVMGAALGLTASTLIARSILRPLSSLESAALAVADGNLKARARATGPREFARLGTSFNQMTESLLRDIAKRKRAEEELRQSEERVRLLMDSTGEAIYGLDLDGNCTFCNPACLRILGYAEPGDLLEKNMHEMIHHTRPDGTPYPEEECRIYQSFQRGEGTHVEDEVLWRADGTSFAAEYWSYPVKSGDESVGSVMTFVDITERKRAEEALRQSEERYRDLFENTSDLIQSVAMDGSFIYVNRAWRETLGYSEEEIRSLNMFDIIHPDSRDHCMEMFQHVMAGESLDHVETEFVTKQGRSIWVEGNAFARFRDGKPVATRGIFRDVTERKQAEETVRHLAYHDALTDLPNRALFKDRLTLALAQAKRNKHMLAVMFLDLDRFKAVNDTAGHKQGDRLLQSVGKQLKELVREGDTVARMGGDEFILLLPEVTGVEHAATIAERILKSFQGPRVLAGHEFHITTSIGITVCPADGGDAETLLRNADIAMYRAKEEGRDNFQIYSADMQAKIAERLALESDLRHALEREEFILYYQPQVDIGTGQIVGTEALVRWDHPDRGLVSPMEFIPLAEETDLIVELGEWVLRTACAQNKAWQEAGIPAIRVAVNVSSLQFQRRDLVETVMQVLNETGLDPNSLEVEITESTAIQDVDHTIAVLRCLRDVGVRVAIDDFGTGHSALSYLKRFPVDAVKIDQSFVRDITIDPDDAAIAATVITIAHDLKLSVIAEGVETEEQLAFLKERGCDEMQGYLFSKPMPAEQIEKALAQGERPQVLSSSLKSR